MDTAKKTAAANQQVTVKQKTNFQKTLSRFFSRSIAVIGLVIVVLMVFFSLFGGYATEYDFSNRNSKHRYQGRAQSITSAQIIWAAISMLVLWTALRSRLS